MRLIDGRAIAKVIADEVAEAAAGLKAAGTTPSLAVVNPTPDEAARWYVRSIQRQAAKVGLACEVHDLAGAGAGELRSRLTELSADPAVHGIICQTPLPDG